MSCGLLVRCVGAPPTPCTECDGKCVDLNADSTHCGACGTVCGSGTVCKAAQCVSNTGAGDGGLGCPGAQQACNGACVNLSTDPANCGTCGRMCADGQKCSASDCVASCGAGLMDCGGACVDLGTDPDHCGACTTACAGVHTTANYCAAGTCDHQACSPGFGDCDGNRPNGCEHRVSDDPGNCGACGNSCQPVNVLQAPPCAQADAGTALGDAGVVELADGGLCRTGASAPLGVCRAGACGFFACAPGFRDCDGDPANGCEAAELQCAPKLVIYGSAIPTATVKEFISQELVRLDFATAPTALGYDGGTLVLATSPTGMFASNTVANTAPNKVLRVNGLTLPGASGRIYYQTIASSGFYGMVMGFTTDAGAGAAFATLGAANLDNKTLTLELFDTTP